MRLAGFPFVHEPFAMRTERQIFDVKQCHLCAQHGFFGQYSLHRRTDGSYAAIAAHARNHLALMPEQIFRNIPSAIQFANDLVLGHHDIVEECFAERRIARNQLDWLGRNAGRFHVEQQEADALIFVGLVGAHEAENPICLVRIRRPDFLAIDDPMISLVFAKGLHRYKVTA